jgi:hypothetical protein
MEKKHSPETEAFYKKLILPEEDKLRLTPPHCGYRWFRSNIIALEHYRRSELLPQRKAS